MLNILNNGGLIYRDLCRVVGPHELRKILETNIIPFSESAEWKPHYLPNSVIFVFYTRENILQGVWAAMDKNIDEHGCCALLRFRWHTNEGDLEADQSATRWPGSFVSRRSINLSPPDCNRVIIRRVFQQNFSVNL